MLSMTIVLWYMYMWRTIITVLTSDQLVTPLWNQCVLHRRILLCCTYCRINLRVKCLQPPFHVAPSALCLTSLPGCVAGILALNNKINSLVARLQLVGIVSTQLWCISQWDRPTPMIQVSCHTQKFVILPQQHGINMNTSNVTWRNGIVIVCESAVLVWLIQHTCEVLCS